MLYFIVFIAGICVTNAQMPPTTTENVKFVIYAKDKQFYDLSPETLQYIDPTVKTVFVVHGFLSSMATDNYITNITSAYRDVGYNSICVDWTGYLFAINYPILVYGGISQIGTALGDKILLLLSHGVNLKQVEVFGESLGADIAGFAGRYIKQRTNSTLHRIAGLDPAGPLLGRVFGIFENPNALRATDADIVDISHTDGEFLGTTDNIGSVDFYINGGLSQTACDEATMNPLGGIILNLCSHVFASIIFRVSIGNSDYKASSSPDTCENLVVYGDLFNGNATGIYFLRTENDYPYKSIC
ncbi:lipase member H-B-like [Atheta coriaria]|uniref:lipase member H-B-like n=1 Tax=Dalotia coriaria TaxID=877792 RepID=UPI0031F440F9